MRIGFHTADMWIYIVYSLLHATGDWKLKMTNDEYIDL